MWLSFLAIGVGATIGAWLRFALSIWLNPVHGTVPLGTLAANLLGGYAVGLALAFFISHPELPPQWRLFVVTGLLGGLTTFSSFSAEVVDLLQRQQLGWGLLTIALHLGGSLSMTALGWWSWRLARSLA
ncbi:camphor resistance protein CrcB [Stenotrophomonas pictorum JCM 9942]|uniref:Fluoride-specific ion channel FluC n=1 Tax=Stenotrophomonas pictorum JCM 9942 TaxID=1236960 RepID=A0A0R0A2R8_9GAMM|nr:fluoride efflux transporter CrcB [Stenotrophomonas pictorum]KRG39504.1 camphor resistance protein CrcB [Stenotrophomonas pictorum JCM 9942]